MGQQHFGRGKAILLGEHAVVYGRPAIAVGLDRGVRARRTPAERTSMRIEPWQVEVDPSDESDLAHGLSALLDLHPQLEPSRYQVEVELPAGAGLGCSAAIGVALARAMGDGSDAEIAERSLAWERVFHGNPSGVDSAISAAGGVAMFRRGQPLEPLHASPFSLVIGDSGEPSSTKSMVAQVARVHDRDPAKIGRTFDAIEALVRNAGLAVQEGNLRGLGQLMDLNQALLSSLMLSTTAIEEMCAAAREAGAAGAKLTGAGGGGCMIALAPDPEKAIAIRIAIERLARTAFVAEVRS